MNCRYAAVFLTLFMLMDPANALRCGNRIVSEGDHQVKVAKYCGEPVSMQVRSVYRAGFPSSAHRRIGHITGDTEYRDELLIHDRSYVEVLVEEWVFNFGPRRLMRLIRFENGIVTDVNQLGYGYID